MSFYIYLHSYAFLVVARVRFQGSANRGLENQPGPSVGGLLLLRRVSGIPLILGLGARM